MNHSPLITDFTKDTFIIVLREYFADHSVWTYNENEHLTKIDICDEYTLNLEVEEFRPIITVSRLPVRWTQTSIGQAEGFDWMTGKRSYTDLFDCGIILKCISREGLEAEQLGAEVFNFIHMTRDGIKKNFGILSLNSIELGVEQPFKKDSKYDLVQVPVSVKLLKQESWSSTPVAPTLKDTELQH